MPRGDCLKQDFHHILNNPIYSDIEITCSDGKKLLCCGVILAARSEVFDNYLYGEDKINTKYISVTIVSFIMELLLEYIYTGSLKEEALTKDNIIEVISAAILLKISGALKIILNTIQNNITNNNNYAENYAPEWLSKAVTTPLKNIDGGVLELLVEKVATIPLNAIEFGRLSIAGFQYLLEYTRDKERSYAIYEYEVFRYGAILAGKRVSNEAYETLVELMPTLNDLEKRITEVGQECITDHQNIAKELEPLIQFIDLRKISGRILTNIIEPLGIIPSETIFNVYRHIIKTKFN